MSFQLSNIPINLPKLGRINRKHRYLLSNKQMKMKVNYQHLPMNHNKIWKMLKLGPDFLKPNFASKQLINSSKCFRERNDYWLSSRCMKVEFLQKQMQSKQVNNIKQTRSSYTTIFMKCKEKEYEDKFQFQNQIYKVTCYYQKGSKMEFKVEEKKKMEFYCINIVDGELPKNIAFYRTIDSIYSYYSLSPSEKISYNISEKTLLFKDTINGILKYFSIQLYEKTLSSYELQELKLERAQRSISQLTERLAQETAKVIKFERIVNVMKEQEEDLKRELKNYQRIIECFNKNSDQADSQILSLRNKLRNYERRQALDYSDGQTLKKKSPSQQENLSRSHQIKRLLDNFEDDQESNENSHHGFLKWQQDRGIANFRQQETARTQLIYPAQGSRINLDFPTFQRNYYKYAFTGNTITKVFGEKQSHLLYFSQKINESSEKCFIEVKNMSKKVTSQNPFRIILGVISIQKVNEISCKQAQQSIYFNAVKGQGYNFRANRKREIVPTFDYGDTFTMSIDMQNLFIDWLIQGNEIWKQKIPFGIGELHPFIEIGGKYHTVEIL